MKLKSLISFATAMVITSLGCVMQNVNCESIEADSVTVYSLYPTKDSVDDFFVTMDIADGQGAGVGDRALLNDEKNCYWIRTVPENPSDPSLEDLWMYLYKDSNTGATHLCFENNVTLECEVVRFTGNDGGLGVTSLALGDLNNDGSYEIYFTYSWNPDTYFSQVGYFDTKTSDVHYFGDYVCPDSELVFTSENDTLAICKAELTHYEDKVHFELEPEESIAEIVCNDDEIEIEPLSDDFIKLEEKLEPTEKPLPDWLPKNAEEASAFMYENGIAADTTTVVKDDMICSVIYINRFDSTRSDRICISEKSDVKAPVSLRKYIDEYHSEYIVSCFEMMPDSYLEIYNKRYYPEILGSYISDENGNVNEVFKGDVNKDGVVSISDFVMLQGWLLGKDNSLGCWQLADICNDNRIDAFDIIMLKKLLTENK